jgi:hypothetical protein
MNNIINKQLLLSYVFLVIAGSMTNVQDVTVVTPDVQVQWRQETNANLCIL